MSVDLEFKPEERAASVTSATDPSVLFGETELIVPVRFRVDGQDILRSGVAATTVWSVDPGGTAAQVSVELESWTQQPLLGFLPRLRQAIEEAQRSGRSRCYLIDNRDLTLRLRDGSQLEVTSPDGTTTAVAPIHEFTDAISRFEKEIQGWLVEHAPQLMAHPSWAEWFPSQER